MIKKLFLLKTLFFSIVFFAAPFVQTTAFWGRARLTMLSNFLNLAVKNYNDPNAPDSVKNHAKKYLDVVHRHCVTEDSGDIFRLYHQYERNKMIHYAPYFYDASLRDHVKEHLEKRGDGDTQEYIYNVKKAEEKFGIISLRTLERLIENSRERDHWYFDDVSTYRYNLPSSRKKSNGKIYLNPQLATPAQQASNVLYDLYAGCKGNNSSPRFSSFTRAWLRNNGFNDENRENCEKVRKYLRFENSFYLKNSLAADCECIEDKDNLERYRPKNVSSLSNFFYFALEQLEALENSKRYPTIAARNREILKRIHNKMVAGMLDPALLKEKKDIITTWKGEFNGGYHYKLRLEERYPILGQYGPYKKKDYLRDYLFPEKMREIDLPLLRDLVDQSFDKKGNIQSEYTLAILDDIYLTGDWLDVDDYKYIDEWGRKVCDLSYLGNLTSQYLGSNGYVPLMTQNSADTIKKHLILNEDGIYEIR